MEIILVLGLTLSLCLNFYLLGAVNDVLKYQISLAESVVKLGKGVIRTQERVQKLELTTPVPATNGTSETSSCTLN